jgi:AsmA-like C-terminal region
MKGDLRWDDVLLQLSVTTTAKDNQQPLGFNIKLAPHDLALPQMALEGTWNGQVFGGALRVDPQAASGEKTSAEGALKPLSLKAKLEASDSRLSLLNIRIAPVDVKDNGTLIEGDAVVEFGAQALAEIDLKSPRINLDTLLGAGTMQHWRDGGFLEVANQLLGHMPPKMIADFKINVSVLTSGGQALNDVRLVASLQPEAIRVHEFVAELPGRSIGQFNGIVFPGTASAQLGGSLTFQSQDMRTFLGWLLPDWKSSFAKHWTGSRGQLAVRKSRLDWSGERIALDGIAFELDGVEGQAKLAKQFGQITKTSVDINTGALDIDSLMPNGWSVLRDGGLTAFSPLAIQQDLSKTVEQQIDVTAKSVLLNGVKAENVELGFVTGPQGFELRQLNIGSVGGAKLTSGGSLVDQGNGPEGEISFKLNAQDPRGFLRLVGLEYGGGTWATALGPTQIEARVSATPQKTGPEIEIATRGSSGVLNMEFVANVRELEKGRDATVAGSGGLSSSDSAALMKVFGVVPTAAVGPGDLSFEFKGTLSEGLVFATRLKALNAFAKFEGTAKPQQVLWGITGQFLAEAADGLEVLTAFGFPLAVKTGAPFAAKFNVDSKDGRLVLSDVEGQIAGRRIAGEAEVSAAGRIKADFETDALSLRDAAALLFMPWEGPAVDASQSFVDVAAGSWTGEVFIRPLVFETLTSLGQKEVIVAFGFDQAARRLSISSAGQQGLKADVVLKPMGDRYALSGNGVWQVELGDHLKISDGTAVLTGQMEIEADFNGRGRSPAAMLAALNGQGRYALSDATLPRLTLDGFGLAVLSAKTPDALSAALKKLDQAPGTRLGQKSGQLVISNGEVVFSVLDLAHADEAVKIASIYDAASGDIKVQTTLTIPARQDLPPVTVTYAGRSANVTVRNGSSALAAKLGYELLSAEMAELEKLQLQQQALAVKEETQRQDDVKRFADYQATRAELRKQSRVRRFHAAERDARDVAWRVIVDQAVASNAVQTKLDLARHARRLMVRRALAP